MEGRVDADVVICSWAGDDRALTLAVLRAAAEQALPGRVLLVDMSPARDLADEAAQIADLEVHWRPDSSGLGESRQFGIGRARGRYVAILDSDAMPRPGWLKALRTAIEPGDVAVAGGPARPLWPSERPPPRLFKTQIASDYLSMLYLGPKELDVPRVFPCNMIVDRELTGESVFTIGMGRNRGDLLSAEETAMMLRVRAQGRRIVYTPDAVVDHHTHPDRMSWRWMWRRVHAAGREGAIHGSRLEPLPRKLALRDRLVLAIVAPAYLHGRYIAARSAAGEQVSALAR